MFIKEIGLSFSFLEVTLSGFWDECNTGSIKWFRQYSFPFYVVEKFKESWY
jgi:hypothetical protein